MYNYKYDNNQILSEDIRIITNNINTTQKIVLKNAGIFTLYSAVSTGILPFTASVGGIIVVGCIVIHNIKKQIDKHINTVDNAKDRLFKLDKQFPLYDQACILPDILENLFSSKSKIKTKTKTIKIDKNTKKIINDFYFINWLDKSRILRETKTIVTEDHGNQIIDYQINLVNNEENINEKVKQKKKSF